MYFKLKQERNVSNFQLNFNHISWLKDECLILNNNKLFDVYNYVLLENSIVYSLKERGVVNVYLYNIEDKTSKLIFENGGLGYNLFGKYLISISNKNTKSKDIFDVVNNEIIFKSKIPINSVFDESVYTRFNSNLTSLSLVTGSQNWQTDLSLYGEIRKIVGVVEDTLWVLMYRAGANKDEGKLLGMDIITGNITIEINETSFLSDCFVEKIEEKGTLLSIYGKISTQPADSPLIEVDALTGSIIRKHRIESLYQENLKIGLWKYFDDKIYFTASKDYINTTHIGVLDYNTLKLLWVDEVKERKAGLTNLQVTKNKIYVLDQGKQLHIYEKE